MPKIMCTEAEGKTRQSERDSCDINRIMARFQKTGKLPVYERIARYGDVSNVPTLMEAFAQVERAQKVFNEMPLVIRKKCDYDPKKVIEYIQDEKNRPELEELGILKQKEVVKVEASPKDPPK